jgi:hypothetical protein
MAGNGGAWHDGAMSDAAVTTGPTTHAASPAAVSRAAAHRATAELVRLLDHIRASPADAGVVDLVVRRPAIGERELLVEGELSVAEGLVGDTWNVRSSRRTSDGSPHPDMQLNVINSRVARAVAGDDPDDRALAGDELHVDLDLGPANLPAGTRLAVGTAVIEVTDQPHTGCAKFAARFGAEALRFVTTGVGGAARFRGINAKVVQPGVVRPGDAVTKLA